jgi:hypothetical protein
VRRGPAPFPATVDCCSFPASFPAEGHDASSKLEFDCAEDNRHVVIGKESYFLDSDRNLMPTRKDQPPPEFRSEAGTGK